MKLALDAGKVEYHQPKIQGEAKDWYMDWSHCHWTMFDFWTNYLATDGEYKLLIKPDGKPASEVTFEIPYCVIRVDGSLEEWTLTTEDKPDDQVKVYICGTIDNIGKIKGGCYCIRDFKTTGFWDVKKYLGDYRMSHQLRFYVLALKQIAKLYPDSQLGGIGLGRLGAIVDGIFLKEKTSELSFKRSEVFLYPDDDINRFHLGLLLRIKHFAQAIKDGTVYFHEGVLNSTCELKYNKCPFWLACASNNEYVEKQLLERDFVQRTYDPLHRDIV